MKCACALLQERKLQTLQTWMSSSNRRSSANMASARKIKDNVAVWHNLMLKWDKLNNEGFQFASNILNMRRSQGDLQPSDDAQLSSSSLTVEHQTAALQDECCRLQNVLHQMVVIVSKMTHLLTIHRGIQDLEEFQFGAEGRASPLCHSWMTREFESSFAVLLAAFEQELKLKQIILQELAHTASFDLSMVYLSCWLHQPFIPSQTRLSLEALLLEAGHRPL